MVIEQKNTLTLKWGDLKNWQFCSEKGKSLLNEYFKINENKGNRWGFLNDNTPRQKEIICELIDEVDDPKGIYLSWDGKYVSKQKAKDYVMSYKNK